MKKVIKIILLTICLIIFIYSAYNIYKYIVEENANKELNSEIMEEAVTKTSNENTGSETNNKSNSKTPINVDFNILKQRNQDVVGWIYSENTPINYPIVQSNDNQYYLHRMINGKYNSSGSIFMDYRNNSNLEDENTIIYGHNMKSDEMFGTLQQYKNQEYYDSHKIMYYFTPGKSYVIELFTGYTDSLNSDIYDLHNMNKNEREELLKKSDFQSDVIVSETDKLITLSTCSYEYEDARYILIGRLHEILE